MKSFSFVYLNRSTHSGLRIDGSREIGARFDDGGYCLDAPVDLPMGSTIFVERVSPYDNEFAAPRTTIRGGYVPTPRT